MKQQPGLTLIAKTVTRISVWLIILYGMYIILHGHLTPGGGFAGGVVIALAFLNVLLAYGRETIASWLNLDFIHDLEPSAGAIFLTVGVLGIAIGGGFLANVVARGTLFNLWSSGNILLLNIVVGIKVAAGLFFVVWSLAILHITEGGDQ